MSTWRERVKGGIVGFLGSMWRSFLVFLEIIGLRQEQIVEHQAQLARFKLYHTEFRKLLSANNSFLEIIADLEQKKHEGDFFDLPYLKRKVARAVADIHLMADSINTISSGRYGALQSVLEKSTEELVRVMEQPIAQYVEEPVFDISGISGSDSDIVGGKMANLGEMRNRLKLPAPDGFAVTTGACRVVFDSGEIKTLLQEKQAGLFSQADAGELSERLRKAIMTAPLPGDLETEIYAAYDRLTSRLGPPPRLAVRSSALGEDSNLSFAGQFLSVLNVNREGLLKAYREVLASLFSREAIHYRLLHGISDESAAMAVGCIAMIDAVASGVIFSNSPNRSEPDHVLINAVWGLGVTLVDGGSSPETIIISRHAAPRVISRTPSSQTSYLSCLPDSGMIERPIEPEMAGEPTITDDEALQLARWALALEKHFGRPQDIEWAMDGKRRFVLLQSRPLRMLTQTLRTCRVIEGSAVLLSGGDIACPGVGAGVAVHMDDDGDFESFPIGGVLVARRSSPKFVRLMSKAHAIVTDAGSVTGHMANLAREFRVPTLLNTKSATRLLPEGSPVTVDATSGCIYAGIVDDIIRKEAPENDTKESGRSRRETPVMRLLEKISEAVIPLNLTNPASPKFAVDNCRTLHDLARFIHEKSYEEMFRMGETLGDFRASSYHLDVFLPIDLYIIDLGGGVRVSDRVRKVKRSHVTSVPLTAILRGMLHEKIPRFGPKPLDMGGLFSMMMRHAIDNPENDRTFRDPCYALVSDNYLNYTSRVGYHFGVVDTYCGETANKNYINLLFRGGAADIVRRSRRARAISEILRQNGFSVTVNRDLVNARLNKASRKETEEHLEMLGRLLQFMRQMDLAMASDESARQIMEAFLKGDYGLEGITGAKNG
ncbi:phosphoenolpyruvate synthase [Candidatus Poribacteria bacterium]|nr:phosphoenolpyruvate synthase [Candidatus Poribacteria bacterium]